ncbi:MAG: membrane dipeptidase [Flavobacteriaceae bacterium]|jgi:membrane dipeptidase|nr:membrane dipeptidase [Flavobacteriaceae bacterium]
MKPTLYILGLLAFNSCKQAPKETESLEAKIDRIHSEAITIDTHNDINTANFTDSINYTQRLDTQVNLPKMNEGGLDVSWLIVYTGQGELTEAGYEKAKTNALDKFSAIHKLTEEIAPEKIGLATTAAEVRSLINSGKKVAMIGVENAYPIGMDIGNFETYYNLGARYISLSHNGHSQFSDSNTGEKDAVWLHNGLSDFGKEAVAEMNRLGIMIDISHPSKEAMMQMISLSKAPIIASHSSARALCDHSRNLDDEQLLLLKENGGVVQTVAFSSYLNTEKHEARNEYAKEVYQNIAKEMGVLWYERNQFSSLSDSERATFMEVYPKIVSLGKETLANDPNAPEAVSVLDFVNHIDYLVNLIGIDHVGISSDFDGGGGIAGWSDASETKNVTAALVKRGYSQEQINKLWGENLLRVLDEVQAVSLKLKS